jgi:hypothetical protein
MEGETRLPNPCRSRQFVVNDTAGQAPSFSSALVLFCREHQMLIGQAREHGERLIGICDV